MKHVEKSMVNISNYKHWGCSSQLYTKLELHFCIKVCGSASSCHCIRLFMYVKLLLQSHFYTSLSNVACIGRTLFVRSNNLHLNEISLARSTNANDLKSHVNIQLIQSLRNMQTITDGVIYNLQGVTVEFINQT